MTTPTLDFEPPVDPLAGVDPDEDQARLEALAAAAGPAFLAAGGKTPPAPAAVSAIGPLFMDVDWDEEVPPRLPDFVYVQDGPPLCYFSESHLLYGPGGSGKSWGGYHVVASFIRSGYGSGVAIIVDYESNRATVRARLKAMGVTKDEAGRIAYWRVTGSLMPGSLNKALLDEFLETWPQSFILLDSVSKVLSAAGFDENSNYEYNKFESALVDPWVVAGHTSFLIDHTGHPGMNKGPVKARGNSSKADRVSGAAYSFEVVEPWSRTTSGYGIWTCAKDREGNRLQFISKIRMDVTVDPEAGTVKITFLEMFPPEKTASGELRLTGYMREVSKVLAEATEPLSGNKVVEVLLAGTHKFKNKDHIATALRVLAEEGFVLSAEKPNDGRRTMLHSHIKPFTEQ